MQYQLEAGVQGLVDPPITVAPSFVSDEGNIWPSSAKLRILAGAFSQKLCEDLVFCSHIMVRGYNYHSSLPYSAHHHTILLDRSCLYPDLTEALRLDGQMLGLTLEIIFACHKLSPIFVTCTSASKLSSSPYAPSFPVCCSQPTSFKTHESSELVWRENKRWMSV